MSNIDLALKLLAFVLEIAPELSAWIGDLIQGKTDPISVRVSSILAEKSESQKAVEALGG